MFNSDSRPSREAGVLPGSVMVLQAANAAARWHVHQRRKGKSEEPYINHLLEVASLVAHATSGSDTDLIVAALLHDAIEDCEVPADLIAANFGEAVVALVKEVTDDKSLPKAERKRLQVEHSLHKSPSAKLLKLADKTSNLRAVANSPASDWSVARRLEYIEWAQKVAQGLRGTNEWLESQFDAAVEAATASVVPRI